MKVEISKLMEHYIDDEFAPREGDYVDAGAVRDRVMAQLPPERKRRRAGRPVRTVLIAAAVCAALLVSAVAGPNIIRYISPTGVVLVENGGTNVPSTTENAVAPIVLEDGCLWFVLDGERVDITDLVDEDTAYTHVSTDPESGAVSKIIVGGTPEDYGWFELFSVPGQGSMGSGENFIVNYVEIDGELFTRNDLDMTAEEYDAFSLTHENVLVRQGWYVDGMQKLGETFDAYGPIDSPIT